MTHTEQARKDVLGDLGRRSTAGCRDLHIRLLVDICTDQAGKAVFLDLYPA